MADQKVSEQDTKYKKKTLYRVVQNEDGTIEIVDLDESINHPSVLLDIVTKTFVSTIIDHSVAVAVDVMKYLQLEKKVKSDIMKGAKGLVH